MAFPLGGADVCIRATRVPQGERSNVTGLESARLVPTRAGWHDGDRCVAQNGLRLLRGFVALVKTSWKASWCILEGSSSRRAASTSGR